MSTPIKTRKKAASSRANGERGGRPKFATKESTAAFVRSLKKPTKAAEARWKK